MRLRETGARGRPDSCSARLLPVSLVKKTSFLEFLGFLVFELLYFISGIFLIFDRIHLSLYEKLHFAR
jgi:hypothetical protein